MDGWKRFDEEDAPIADDEGFPILLLWFEGAEVPVFGNAYRRGGAAPGISSQAKGVKWTHWQLAPTMPKDTRP